MLSCKMMVILFFDEKLKLNFFDKLAYNHDLACEFCLSIYFIV